MGLAVWERERACAQGIFDGQRQSHLPRLAVALALLSVQGTAQCFGDKAAWGRWWSPLHLTRSALADAGHGLEPRLIARFGGPGQGQTVSPICAETGGAVAEQSAVPALCKPLQFPQVWAGVPSSDCGALWPQLGLRQGLLVRPLQGQSVVARMTSMARCCRVQNSRGV